MASSAFRPDSNEIARAAQVSRRSVKLAPNAVGTILRDVFSPPMLEDPTIVALLAQLDRK
jgi:hypothetical protein